MPATPARLLRRLLRAVGLVDRNHGGPSVRVGHAAELGAWAEKEAERALRAKGYAVIGRNVVTAAGEADLVCRASDGRTMVIVEVKGRVVAAERGIYRPETAVGPAKRKRLHRVAHLLAKANAWNDTSVRVDVVAVERIAERVVVRHHEGIVRFRH